MVTFTREDRRGRVLEYHSQGMDTREIAKLLHMSFTDIAKILKDSDKEKESEQQRTRQEFLSSQAYTLFSEGKSPVQVAIELNIRASEAIIFQREYWELEGLHNLNQIYQEIKGDIWNFVNLWKSVKAAGMGVPHVNRLLTIANNDLSSVELRYEGLKKEAATLEFQKASSARDSELLNNQIIMMRKTRDSTLLDTIIRNAKRLQRLTEDILDVTKIESQSLQLNKEQFNLHEMMLNAIADSNNQLKKDSNTKLELVSKEDVFVEADKARLNQVIANLLSNAIKFTQEEGGSITIRTEIMNSRILVSIKDTGTGIDPEILPRLFTKFVTKPETGGTGLGLFISKSIIEAHDGIMWAENNANGKKELRLDLVYQLANSSSRH
jgi:signal transduction histidine kinase